MILQNEPGFGGRGGFNQGPGFGRGGFNQGPGFGRGGFNSGFNNGGFGRGGPVIEKTVTTIRG